MNTPCRRCVRAEARMDVWKTFFDSFLASTKKEFACRGETRPGARTEMQIAGHSQSPEMTRSKAGGQQLT